MFSKILKSIKYKWSRDGCYDRREQLGLTDMGRCHGLCGGDSNTGNLQYECVECRYFII